MRRCARCGRALRWWQATLCSACFSAAPSPHAPEQPQGYTLDPDFRMPTVPEPPQQPATPPPVGTS